MNGNHVEFGVVWVKDEDCVCAALVITLDPLFNTWFQALCVLSITCKIHAS